MQEYRVSFDGCSHTYNYPTRFGGNDAPVDPKSIRQDFLRDARLRHRQDHPDYTEE